MDPIHNRIMKEYEDMKKNEKENTVTVWMVDNDSRHWKGKIFGLFFIVIVLVVLLAFAMKKPFARLAELITK